MKKNKLQPQSAFYKYTFVQRKQEDLVKDSGKISLDALIKIIGIIFVIPTLILSYCNYRQSEKWKVAEFAGKEFNNFKNDQSFKTISTILDYSKYHVKLFEKQDSLYYLTNADIMEALLVDSVKQLFTLNERRVRDLFDNYFDHLSLFEAYLETHLLTIDQVRPYLEYQIDIMADTTNRKKDMEFRKVLWLYIYNYFPSVKNLCSRFVPYAIDTLKYIPSSISMIKVED